MSSASFGPYKSRLFNFINRKSIQWGDRIGRGLRNLKVAATWGSQILLYPVYLLVQSVRVVGQKFSQAVKQAELPRQEEDKEQIIPSTPILNLLQEIKPLLNSSGGIVNQPCQNIEAAEKNLAKIKTTIQGIAVLLSDRSLVLVSSSNEILDILTSGQKQKLQQRIAWEIANYRRHLRLLKSANTIGYKLIQPREKPQILTPIRLFWRLMNWVQASPVAKAVNLFQEAVFVKHTVPLLNPAPEVNLFNPLIPSPKTLTNFDAAIANWESGSLVPVVKAISSLKKNWGGKLQSFKTDLANNSTNSQGERVEIKALILAAIQYFFGQNTSSQELPEQSNSNQELPKPFLISLPKKLKNIWLKRLNSWRQSALVQFTPNQSNFQKQYAMEPDPWLSWSDLYGNTLDAEISEDEIISSYQPQLTGCERQPRTSKDSLFDLVKNHLSPQDSNFIKAKPVTQTITTLTPATVTCNAVASPSQETLNPAFDWIETEGVHVGYVKHPLEIILDILDSIMVWLEELVIKIWQWLTNLAR